MLRATQPSLDPELLCEAGIAAVSASMRVIKDGATRISEVLAQGVVKKADDTLKTNTDEESGLAAIVELQARFPGVPIVSEDSGVYGETAEDRPRGFMVDGLDGTTPFLEGKDTSTAIVASYNSATGEIEHVTIGRPSTGEVWFSDRGRTKTVTVDVATGAPTNEVTDVFVSREDLGPNTTVLIEKLNGFRRDDGTRQILSDKNVAVLAETINQRARVLQQGSNGLNLAQVASGQDHAIASITTAIGGEWDVAGALAVMNAGGVAEGWRMNDDRTITSANPLRPFEYDILIAANNKETLSFLKECLHGALI